MKFWISRPKSTWKNTALHNGSPVITRNHNLQFLQRTIVFINLENLWASCWCKFAMGFDHQLQNAHTSLDRWSLLACTVRHLNSPAEEQVPHASCAYITLSGRYLASISSFISITNATVCGTFARACLFVIYCIVSNIAQIIRHNMVYWNDLSSIGRAKAFHTIIVNLAPAGCASVRIAHTSHPHNQFRFEIRT